ncbi:oligosaccharide repeat unit polymerase [Qipengyuania sp. GH38]|uniref:O-antigen polymerase n=1 Tax=Qipengyuania intermedia TaxID=2867244 RepID=UPI001C8807CC|nr:O-antigen polymerase [Qipengyuania intermedia]MBX7513483.1 oligosaccharide repeat unit polymerase [Qipengyuania intermedia]
MYDFLLLASFLTFLATSVFYLRHPSACIMHPATFYLAFHGLVFAFRPILARVYDFGFVYRLYDFQPSMSDKITVILATNLAMIVFVAASLYVAPRLPVALEPDRFEAARASMKRPVLAVCALLAPFAIWSQLGNWQRQADNYGSMIRDLSTGAAINTDAIGWFTDAALILAPITVLLIWLAKFRWWSWGLFLAFVVLQGGGGTRGPIIYTAVAIGILALLEYRRRWVDWRAAGLAVLAILTFNQIVTDRGASLRGLAGQAGEADYATNFELSPFEGMDFANLEYFEYIVYAVPQRTGTYDYFASNLQIFTEPVPRVFWKDKPVGSPVQYFSLWDYGTPIGMTASLPGQGWMALGYLGVAIQALFFALLYSVALRFLLGSRATPLRQILYALIIATAINVFRDGTIVTFARQAPFYIGPFLMVLMLKRILSPPVTHLALAGEGPVADFLAQPPGERRRILAAQSDPHDRRPGV